MSSNDRAIHVRYFRDVQKLSFRQIALQTEISRSTVSRIYSGDWKGPPMKRGFLLDPLRDLLMHWYQECPTLKAVQIHRRLIDRGIAIDVTTVAKYTREFRQKKKSRVYWPLEFRSSTWIDDPQNLILIGDAGLGKSHIAKALCYDAILHGRSAYFISVFDLASKIKRAPNPAAKIDFYGKVVNVLALDELGYAVYQKEDIDVLFQIVSKRSETLPTIVTTNLPPKQWGSIFSGPAASAVLDRLSFNGKFITMEGRSYRLRSKLK